jgi:hypothetical protein
MDTRRRCSEPARPCQLLPVANRDRTPGDLDADRSFLSSIAHDRRSPSCRTERWLGECGPLLTTHADDDPKACITVRRTLLRERTELPLCACRCKRGKPELSAVEPANWKHEAHQPSWRSVKHALVSIRFFPADRPRLASSPARSRTTSTTWPRSPDANSSRFALYRCDQLRSSSPPLSTVTCQC